MTAATVRQLAARGDLLSRQGNSAAAVVVLEQALELQPGNAGLQGARAVALMNLGRLDEAAALFGRALALGFAPAKTHNNLGVLYWRQGRLEESREAFERAVALSPHSGEMHANLGNVLTGLCRFDEALFHHRQAQALSPQLARNGATLLYTLSYHPTMPAAEIAEAFRAWGRGMAATSRPWPARPRQGRLRVGYVSPDFRNHSTRFYLEPLLEKHDRDAFELFAYANVAWPDADTARLRGLFDHWSDICGMSDAKTTALIRRHDLDLLIDVTSHMQGNRLGVFARRAAPVQATWLGTCWTTGLPTMDYAILDPFMAPPDADGLFVETLVRLPHTLFCYRRDLDWTATPLPAARKGHVTFGYTGRSERLNDRVFAAWAAILRQLPSAHLVLDYSVFGSFATASSFMLRLMDQGIGIDRVSLRCSPGPLAALAEIDILLDSFPHSGGTMLFDAIWAGVPFVTLAERPPVGRVGACILSNLGLADWIASDVDQYVALAVAKAGDRDGLAELRRSLRTRAEASPLADSQHFARDMEAAYRRMIERTP